MRVTVDGHAARRRHRQGHHPRHHRRDRHRRRHRPRHRVCRRGDPRAVDGRPHDGLQHVDRGRRARRPGRARREDLRLPEGPAEGAEGRGLGRGGALLGDAALGRGRASSTARSASTPPSCRRSSPGARRPRTSSRSTGVGAGPGRRSRTRTSAARSARALDYMGLKPRHEDHRHRARPRLHRLVHQRPHRGPARRRQGRRGPARSPPASTP